MEELLIIGAGATGRELANIIFDINDNKPTWNLIGFLDDDPAKLGQTLHGIPVLGPIASASQYSARIAISIAVLKHRSLRHDIIAGLRLIPEQLATIIHPSSIISRFASVGPGTIVMSNTVINTDTVIGKSVIIQYHCSISHDVVIEDFVTIAPSATICGYVQLQEGAYVGAGSVITNGTASRRRLIGAGALIGLGAVVIRDVPPGMTAVGNPARLVLPAVESKFDPLASDDAQIRGQAAANREL